MKPIKATWKALDYRGEEHLELTLDSNGLLASSVIIWYDEHDQSHQTTYELQADKQADSLQLSVTSDNAKLRLTKIGPHWKDANGHILAELDDCQFFDFEATPFTNIFPVNQLKKKVGLRHRCRIVYITFPNLTYSALEQFYTFLGNGRWRFEQPADDFIAEIEVDKASLVTSYPGLFERSQ